MATIPSPRLNWCPDNDPAKVVQPSDALTQQGYVPGQPVTAGNLNYLLRYFDQYTQSLDDESSVTMSNLALLRNMRLCRGGDWNLSGGTLSWSAQFDLAVPGIEDGQNGCPAGSIPVPDGNFVYVDINLPFSTQGDVQSGSVNIQNVVAVSGISTGDSVNGDGIPGGTTVQSISGNTVTLTASATSTEAGASLQFISANTLSPQTVFTDSFESAPNRVVIARGFDGYVIVGANSGQMILHDTETRQFLGNGFLDVISATAGQSILYGQALYISDGSNGNTAGNAYLCNASVAGGSVASNFAGIAQSNANTGDSLGIIASGIIPYGTYTPGSDYYLDPANAGGLTTTRPANPGDYPVHVGVAYDASHLLLVKSDRGKQNGVILSYVAGQNLQNGQFVYISSGAADGGRTANTVYPTDVSAPNGALRSTFVGITISSATAGNAVNIFTGGKLALFSGLIPGQPYYLDPASNGYPTINKPTTAGQYLVPAGVALDSATMYIVPVASAAARALAYSATQPANLFFASPVSGSGSPLFRTIQTADIPAIAFLSTLLFGDGSDGSPNITGSVTLSKDMNYLNLTISGAGTIKTNGYKIFVQGTLTLDNAAANAIQATGGAGGNGTSSAAGAGGAVPYAVTGQVSLGNGSAGGAGSVGAGTTGAAGSALSGVSMGGTGGGGGGTPTGSGAGGARSLVGTFRKIATDLIAYNAGALGLLYGGTGGGGGGAGGGGGGGGGAGGGVVAVYANTISVGTNATASVINANGGSGGNGGLNGSYGTGGSGGGGGFVYLIYQTLVTGNASGASFVGASGGSGGTALPSPAANGATGGSGNVLVYSLTASTSKLVPGTTSIP